MIDIFNDLGEPSCSTCSNYSLTELQNIKENVFYKSCKQAINKNLKLSDFIFFIFELTSKKENKILNQYI